MMKQNEFCEKCGDRLRCQDAFRQMGKTQGKHVVRNIILAFLLPIVIFIGVLAISQQLLINHIVSDGLRTTVSVLLSLAVTFVYVLIARVISRRL
jgi:uncharacterized membrane protein (DUF485 family)